MRFLSTRRRAAPAGFSEAIFIGLAGDGGLFVPEDFPVFDPRSLGSIEGFADFAARVIEPFLEDDPLAGELGAICRRAFDFPVPLDFVREDTAVLELFHGPTAAFKDFGARFLAGCMEAAAEGRSRDERPVTVLVATSGDTGSAVASAFHRRDGMRVAILFPKGGVSPRQEHQLTCWGDNVRAFAVRGSFDDCQRVAKAAFGDESLRRQARLTSANSINIGRLLPQSAYYAAASVWYQRRTGRQAGFIVPTGNVGNAVGAFWAKRMGFPIRRIAMATNANRTIPDWFASGEWEPRPSISTLANAMDVGDPSNMERLFDLYPDRRMLLHDACSESFDDETIRDVIVRGPAEWGRVWCPHTATAVRMREKLGEPDWVIVATAHPAKFETIVEPLIGRTIVPPPRLAELLDRPKQFAEIEPDVDELRRALDD